MAALPHFIESHLNMFINFVFDAASLDVFMFIDKVRGIMEIICDNNDVDEAGKEKRRNISQN